jgi:hypothetical protein
MIALSTIALASLSSPGRTEAVKDRSRIRAAAAQVAFRMVFLRGVEWDDLRMRTVLADGRGNAY